MFKDMDRVQWALLAGAALFMAFGTWVLWKAEGPASALWHLASWVAILVATWAGSRVGNWLADHHPR